MKKSLLFFAVILLGLITAQSQITITSSNMPMAGKIYFAANDTNVNSVGPSGANQFWDYSGWDNHFLDTAYFTDPTTLSGYSSFTNSNLGLLQSGSAEIFLNNYSSSFDILGFYGDFLGNGNPIPLIFNPAQTFISFPSNYQTTFNGSTKYEITMPYPNPPADSVKQISYNNYFSEIDAWGMINTPSFSNVNVLRQKYTEIKTDSIFVHAFNTWTFSGTVNVDTTISYRYWSGSKEYPVAEIITDGWGNVTSAQHLYEQNSQVQVSFTANPTNGCAPLTVDFTNTSTSSGGTVYYDWYFGDGSNNYFGFDTSHTYTSGGNFWVQLNAYDANFNFLGSAYTIIFIGGSAGFFEMGADSVCPGDNVNFRGQDGAFDYQWDFGDGAFASGSQWESHTYTSTGTFPVTLIVSDACGMDTIIQNIFVGNNVTPQSDFNIWPTEVCPNQPVELYNNNVGNNFQWNFGDGNNGNGQYITHPYSNVGSYNITCVVTNSCNISSTSSATVLVSSNAPFPWGMQIVNWPQSSCPGTEIFFSAPNWNASYIWNYGDGTPNDTSGTNEVSHSFAAVGTYNVSVNITSFCGNDTTIYTTVVIDNNVPFNGWFDINVNPLPACPGSTVYFNGWSNDAVSYQWNYGDGSFSSSQNTSHVYPNVGNYNASLTLTNQCGSDTLILFVVNINNNVMPDPNDYDYGVTVDTACSGDSILFYIAPGNSGTYLWNFGDGTATSTTFPYSENGFTVDLATHVYANNGVYNVIFTLTNQCGNSFTDSFTVTIGSNVPVDGDLWTNGENFCPDDTIKFTAVGGGTYVWNFGDGTAPFTSFGIITDVFHAFNFSGEYAVSVNITNSCGNSAVYTDTISVDSCMVGLNQLQIADFGFQIYPNPNKGEFNLQFIPSTRDNLQFEKVNLKIYNVLGEMVYSKQMKTTNEQLSTNLPSGIYFLKIETNEGIKTQKIIIE